VHKNNCRFVFIENNTNNTTILPVRIFHSSYLLSAFTLPLLSTLTAPLWNMFMDRYEELLQKVKDAHNNKAKADSLLTGLADYYQKIAEPAAFLRQHREQMILLLDNESAFALGFLLVHIREHFGITEVFMTEILRHLKTDKHLDFDGIGKTLRAAATVCLVLWEDLYQIYTKLAQLSVENSVIRMGTLDVAVSEVDLNLAYLQFNNREEFEVSVKKIQQICKSALQSKRDAAAQRG
jgi:hypothetical protein